MSDKNQNTGYLNTGHQNTGYQNTGYLNTGHRNTGNWNTGNWNAGDLNTGDGRVEVFGKPTDIKREDLRFPDFFYHNTAAVWVPKSEMTDSELAKYATAETVGGYLKKVDPKAGWRAAWDSASDDDRRKCFAIPNWDNEMFKEISGIDVEAELSKPDKTIRVGDKNYRVSDVERALSGLEEVK